MKTFNIFFDGPLQKTMIIKAPSEQDAREWTNKQIKQWNKENDLFATVREI